MSLPTIEEMQVLDNGDLQTYWSGSFAKMTKPGQDKGIWVQVANFEGSKGNKKVYWGDDTGNSHVHPLDGDITWSFEIPKARVYNFKNNVCKLVRLPHRQWKKGLCSETFSTHENLFPYLTKFKVIPGEMYHHFTWGTTNLNTMLEEMGPIPFKKSLEAVLKQQALARVFSDRVSLSQGVMSKNPTLWFDSAVIGEFLTKSDRVVLRGPEFQFEIESIFAEHGIEVVVKQ